VYPHLVSWEGVGEDTERSYSVYLREISKNVSRERSKKLFGRKICASRVTGVRFGLCSILCGHDWKDPFVGHDKSVSLHKPVFWTSTTQVLS
jgi:hypothetical protein